MNRYDFIVGILKKAGDVLKEARAEGFETKSKNGDARDIVTSVDVRIDGILRKEIEANFRGEAIYSEEVGKAILDSKTFWTIDPIDGTSNFSRGIPHFAICIGFVENGVSVCGGIYNPITDELFSFEKGRGAFLNGKSVNISNIRELKDASVIFHAGRDLGLRDWGGETYKKLLDSAKKTINLSSSALDNVFVGAGRVEACIYGRIHSFDISCAIGFVLEAGGIVVGEDWKPLRMSFDAQKVITANSKEILTELKSIL